MDFFLESKFQSMQFGTICQKNNTQPKITYRRQGYSPVQLHVTGSIVEVEVWWSLESGKWRVVSVANAKLWIVFGGPWGSYRQCRVQNTSNSWGVPCAKPRGRVRSKYRLGSHTEELRRCMCQNRIESRIHHHFGHKINAMGMIFPLS